MKATAHVPEPVSTTYSIEGLTEQEAQVLLALVGSIGDETGSYLVTHLVGRKGQEHFVLGDGRHDSPLRHLCDNLYSHLRRVLR